MRRHRLVTLLTVMALAGIGVGAPGAYAPTTTTEAAKYDYDHVAASAQGDCRSPLRPTVLPAPLTAAVKGLFAPVGFVRRAGVAAEEAPGVPRYVYRGGSNSADNLTPRLSDTSGLSTFDNLEAATPPGGKAQVIDTTRLRCRVS